MHCFAMSDCEVKCPKSGTRHFEPSLSQKMERMSPQIVCYSAAAAAKLFLSVLPVRVRGRLSTKVNVRGIL